MDFRFLSFAAFLLLLPLFCTGAELLHSYCDNGGAPQGPSQEMAYRMGRVLRFVVAYGSVYGFSTYAEGEGSDRMYALAQCRRDLSLADCAACLADAGDQLPNVCPGKVDTRLWFDHCFVRYDSEDFMGKLDTGIAFEGPDDDTEVTEPERFEVERRKLFDEVRAQAVRPGSNGLGKAQTQFTPSQTLYALFQCTEDLSPENCAACLDRAEQTFQGSCLHKANCSADYSSCYMHYTFHPF